METLYEFKIVRFDGTTALACQKDDGSKIPKERKADVAIWLRGEVEKFLKEYNE